MMIFYMPHYVSDRLDIFNNRIYTCQEPTDAKTTT